MINSKSILSRNMQNVMTLMASPLNSKGYTYLTQVKLTCTKYDYMVNVTNISTSRTRSTRLFASLTAFFREKTGKQ